MKNTEVENAICYIRDYISRLNDRSQSQTARKMLDCVNVLIDYYNASEEELDKMRGITEQRDLFMHLVIGNGGWTSFFENYTCVPALYYYVRLPESGDIHDFRKSIRKAAWDYYLYMGFLHDIQELEQDIQLYMQLLKKNEDKPENVKIILNSIELAKQCIQDCREYARQRA